MRGAERERYARDFEVRMRARWGASVGAAALALLSACGDDASTTGGGGGATTGSGGAGGGLTTTSTGGSPGSGGAAPFELELSWYACPFVMGQNGECAKTQVPLDWDDPSGEKIDYFLKRIPATQQPARGQVWLLQGGPGASGTSIELLAIDFQNAHPDLDVYVPDHRGTGLSTKLLCDDLDEIPPISIPLDPQLAATAGQSCVDDLSAEWGAGLKFFSATAAARDVGEIIEASRLPTDDVFVFGVSYGTRWAHRYLQQYPTQSSGVIFDSIVGEVTDWYDFDLGIDGAAHALFDACSADAYCSSRLGNDAWGFLGALMAKLDTGHCPTSADLAKDDYRALLAWLLQQGFYGRSLVPAIANRIDRCSTNDQAILLWLRQLSIDGSTGVSSYFSGGLHFNVVAGELAGRPTPSEADILAADASLRVSSVQMLGYRAVVDLWPAYEHDAFQGAYADTATPLLFLQSPLDAQTTIGPASELASHYVAANQTFVTIDRGSHGLVSQSPTPTGNCGMDLIGQFLGDPTVTLDTSCNDDVLPLDFEHPGETFGPGSSSAWDNIVPVAAGSPVAGVDIRERLRAEAARSFGGVR